MKKLTTLILLALAVAGLSAQIKFDPARKVAYAAQIVENFYVDEIDTTRVVEEAIKGMLKTLDPHSVYSNAEETRDLNEPLEGNFSGIGIRFQMDRDTLYVIEAIVGGPSERVGIRPGDRILECNDTVIAGVKMKNSQILKVLRGPKGTEARLRVKRKGEPEVMDFNVVREDIPINSLDAAYMVNDSVGFISLSRFGATTADEVRDAMSDLRRKGMRHLVIDLSDNGGGYLRSATDIVCGRQGRHLYRRPHRGDDKPAFGLGQRDTLGRHSGQRPRRRRGSPLVWQGAGAEILPVSRRVYDTPHRLAILHPRGPMHTETLYRRRRL